MSAPSASLPNLTWVTRSALCVSSVFPLTAIEPHGTHFSVRVPPQGIAVLEVDLAP